MRQTVVSPDHPVVITKFMLDALEVDVDGVCDGKNVVIGAIVEHIDSAGVSFWGCNDVYTTLEIKQ